MPRTRDECLEPSALGMRYLGGMVWAANWELSPPRGGLQNDMLTADEA